MFKKKEKPKKKKKVDKLGVFLIAMILVGYYILMFPTSADLLNKIMNQNTINAYNASMVSYSDDDIATMKQKLVDYNEEIYESEKTTVFRYKGPNATDETYTSLPTASDEIGTVRIPSINVNVPFVHGTKDSSLQSEAGHLYGTSFPIDGDNVHAVIAAHSALQTAKLFTDLTKVKAGDTFYVTVLNTEYEYKVDQIKTVLPEDDYQYEQIEEGKNYVTLYTCTPYGINTHRLLVRGELIGSKEVSSEDNSKWSGLLTIIKYSAELAGVLLLPFILMWLYRLKVNHNIKKKEKNKKSGNSSKKIEKEKDVSQSTTIDTILDASSVDDDVGIDIDISGDNDSP